MWKSLQSEKDDRVVREFINLMVENDSTNSQDVEYKLCLAKDTIKQIDKEIKLIENKCNKDTKERVRESWLKKYPNN